MARARGAAVRYPLRNLPGESAVLDNNRFLTTAALAAVVGWITIDVFLSAAYWSRGTSPLVLIEWDASNLIGPTAFSGGWWAVTLGLAADLVVSFVWAAICVAVMSRYRVAETNWLAFGVIFGAFVMLVMLWVVVPLGRAPLPKMTPAGFLITLIAHTAFFGVPVAYAAARLANRLPA
jgi:hypothetical protein